MAEASTTETAEAESELSNEERSLLDLINPVTLPTRHKLGLVGLLVLGLLPVAQGYGIDVGFFAFTVDSLLLDMLTGAMFFAVFAMTWDFVSGYTGEISFGHAIFFGGGAYSSAILHTQLGLSLFVTIPLGMLVAGLIGLLIGVPSLRLQGPYFSLVTLVAPIIVLRLFVFWPEITGGATGLLGAGTLTTDTVEIYVIGFGVFVMALAVFLLFTRSDAGIVLTAIREDELAVEAAGLNPAKFKIFAFVLSGLVGGLAGAIYVHTFLTGIANPSQLIALVISIEIIVASILGGMGTIVGAAIGGLFFHILRDTLRGVETTVPVVGVPVADIYFLLFAIVTLVFLFFLPEGILPRMLRAGSQIEDRIRGQFGGEPTADGGQPRAAERRRDARGRGKPPLRTVVENWTEELRELFDDDRGDRP
ncbi:branched-chain amino acid ABC transporter permease [Haloglomus litoreum]|uniref:branched-chain amino acid ABC transporter permease n=1 Tax=Haloglomus litoreum TaxID=3034026 RepID=UPI0023E8150A|nr:branched-chain amino acid ABC transporter permease [Haloglomus sp. DT116]